MGDKNIDKTEKTDSKKKTVILRIWNWIKIVSLLLGLICGSILIYRWWDRRQKLAKLRAKIEQLEKKAYRQYELQKTNLISTAALANNPAIHSFFTDLLRNYAKKFAESKNLDASCLPLIFEGLFLDKNTESGLGEMGHCSPREIIYPHHTQEINIGLNRLYLLNKFGHDKYFTSHPSKGDYYYIDISFRKMIDTCSHELSHYIQLVKHGRSSCESDLKLENGKYDGELAQEHKELTEEIYGMIKNSREYLELERRWKEI